MVKTKTMRNATKAFFLIIALLLAAGLAIGIAHALPPPPAFELDGDATDSNGPLIAPDDWNTVFTGVPESVFPLGKVFIVDGDCAACAAYFDPTTFTGSADVDDVDDWQWVSAGVDAAKAEITDAYAVAYSEGDGNFTIYFGLDRCATGGTTSFGFWFFQDVIGLNPDHTFSGLHQVGDILVQATFTGNRIDVIQVFEWWEIWQIILDR